jgi:hypothetical protein
MSGILRERYAADGSPYIHLDALVFYQMPDARCQMPDARCQHYQINRVHAI